MRKAMNRFLDWIFHPSVRRDPMPRGKAMAYRYPTPGSVLSTESPAPDYRTPFSNTKLDIRRQSPTHSQTQQRQSVFIGTPANLPIPKKLIFLDLLSEKDENNQSAIEEASKKFKQLYGIDVKEYAFRNDFDISTPNLTDREGIRQAISKEFISSALYAKTYANHGTEESVNNPNIMEFNSLDLYDAPHFQQSRIQTQYAIDRYSNMRAETGKTEGINVRKGQAAFWKTVDDSNDPKSVKQIQQKIKDPNDPTKFDLRNAKLQFQFDNDGNVIDIHRKQ